MESAATTTNSADVAVVTTAGGGGGDGASAAAAAADKPYPPPLATYEQVVADAGLFMRTLECLHKALGTKFMVPTIGGKVLDLHHLFVEVTTRGGIEKAISERRWRDVVATFSFPSTITSASFVLRKYYLSLLHPYEQIYYFQSKDTSAGVMKNESNQNGSGLQASTVVPQPNDNHFSGCQPATVAATGCQPATVAATGCQPATVTATCCQPATVTATGCQPATVTATGYQPATVAAISCQPATLAAPSSDDLPAERLTLHPGCRLRGEINGKFENGYIVTLNVGSEKLRGVLYHVPLNSVEPPKVSSFSLQHCEKKRSRRAMKDPSRPKSHRSGYNFFFAEQCAKLKPLYSRDERAIKIGDMWNKLSVDEKEVYQRKGSEDAERYRMEMLEYMKSSSAPKSQ